MIDKIGEAAGIIWRALNDWRSLEFKTVGMTIVQLKKRTNLPAELLHQGLGWLAREDKIFFTDDGKTMRVSLK